MYDGHIRVEQLSPPGYTVQGVGYQSWKSLPANCWWPSEGDGSQGSFKWTGACIPQTPCGKH